MMTNKRKKKDARKTQPANWPAEVPVLLAADLTWAFSTRDGRFDLAYWLTSTFDSEAQVTPHQDAAYSMLLKVLSERLGKRLNSLWLFLETAHKRKSPSLGWQASCWNEAMRRLGYAVPPRQCSDPGRD